MRELGGEGAVSFGTPAGRIIEDDRLTETWSFADTHVTGNDRLVHFLAEMRTHLADHIRCEACAAVEHGHQDPFQLKIRVDAVIAKLVDSQEATFKQLVMEGSRRFLKPLNPSWPEPIIELGPDAIICGVVFSKLEIF